MKRKTGGQLVVYVVMRDAQAGMLHAHRVYFSERRAKSYCTKMNDSDEYSGFYYFQKCVFWDWKAFLTKLNKK